MPKRDDEAKRKGRARALRARIDEIVRGGPPGPKTPPAKESPRDFVERRMRELASPPAKPPASPRKRKRR